jgi:hypothetical protein
MLKIVIVLLFLTFNILLLFLIAAILDLRKEVKEIMANLKQILDDVTSETTVINSIGLVITGLKQQVADALTKTGISTEDQATIDQIFATAENNKAALAKAVTDNTPAAGSSATP